MREDIELLEDHADLLPVDIQVGAFGIEHVAFEDDLAAGRFLQHIQTSQEG